MQWCRGAAPRPRRPTGRTRLRRRAPSRAGTTATRCCRSTRACRARQPTRCGTRCGSTNRSTTATRSSSATSGTTGEPKGVVLTHDAVRASAVTTSDRLGVDPRQTCGLACLPLAHVGGLARRHPCPRHQHPLGRASRLRRGGRPPRRGRRCHARLVGGDRAAPHRRGAVSARSSSAARPRRPTCRPTSSPPTA